MIQFILMGLVALVILQDILVLVFFRPSRPVTGQLQETPMVSVLVAARNEEAHIGACLDALLDQDYPAERMEILIGDDGSEDRTAEIVEDYRSRHTRVRCVSVPPAYAGLRGKARPMACLAREARGEFYLITDADVRPGRTWAATMVARLSEGHFHMVNGITRVKGSVLQDMEWVHAQGLLRTLSQLWRPVTCIGNNMAISRQAYEATGGYEAIPFSLTEDRALFVAASEKGFRLCQLFDPDPLASTLPVPLFRAYLSQRKRWLTGALQIPVGVQLLLGTQSLFILYCLWLSMLNPWAGGLAYLARVVVKLPLWYRLYRSAGIHLNLLHVLWFEAASGLLNLLLLVYSLWPGGVSWKGIKY